MLRDRKTSGEVVELASALSPVFAGFPEIAAVYVFGSVARGDAGPESDLDLGLVLPRGATVLGSYRMVADLAGKVERHTRRRTVDVILLEPQGPIFCHRVLAEGRLIYEADRDRRIDFESGVLVRAFDFRPTWELATRGKVEALRKWLKTRYDLR